MRRETMRFGCLLLCWAVAGVATSAQEPGTFVLRSGERVAGSLVDMGADLTVRVNGADQRYAVGDVLVIDFAGAGLDFPDAELSQIPAGGHLIVMRGGERIQGRLVDVAGNPLELVLETAAGERRVSPGATGRIYLARPPSPPASAAAVPVTPTPAVPATPTPSPTAKQRTVSLLGNIQWVDTGIDVRQGDTVAFSATGQVQLSANGADSANANGSVLERIDGAAPLGNELAGALLGRIVPPPAKAGVARRQDIPGPPFGIGGQTHPLPMPSTGRLFVGINESTVSDNSGYFTVVITP